MSQVAPGLGRTVTHREAQRRDVGLAPILILDQGKGWEDQPWEKGDGVFRPKDADCLPGAGHGNHADGLPGPCHPLSPNGPPGTCPGHAPVTSRYPGVCIGHLCSSSRGAGNNESGRGGTIPGG